MPDSTPAPNQSNGAEANGAEPNDAHSLLWTDDGEPYLRIPGHSEVITPYRDTPDEIEDMCEMGTVEEVSRWTFVRPCPYLPTHARERLDKCLPEQAAAIALLRAGKVPDASPFFIIRNTAGRQVGDVGLYKGAEEDQEPEDGLWTMAYSLHPTVHGKGLGRAAVGALLDWAEGALGVRKVQGLVETRNIASSKLCQRLGFTRISTHWQPWPEEKGGGEREIGVWRRDRE